MQRVTGLFSGRGSYSKSLFGEEDGDERKEATRASSTRSSSRSPMQEAATPMTTNLAWDQAATIRAQLEAELKREQVRSPPEPRASPPQRSRVIPDPTRDRMGSGPSSADEAWEGDGAFKRDKPRKSRASRRGKDDAGQFQQATDFNWDAGPGAFTWPALGAGSAMAAPAAAGRRTSAMEKEKAGTPWGGDLPSSGTVSPEKPHPAASPGSISPRTFEDSPEVVSAAEVEVRAEQDSAPVSAPSMGLAASAAPSIGPAASEGDQASLEPLTGLFDEAILAALVAMPQQALVDFLRRLALRRPSAVALALEPAPRPIAAVDKTVAPLTPEPATSDNTEMAEVLLSRKVSRQESCDSDAGPALPAAQEGQPASVWDGAMEDPPASSEWAVPVDTASNEPTSPVLAVASPSPVLSPQQPFPFASSSQPSEPTASTQQGPASTQSDTPWPPGPTSGAGSVNAAATTQGTPWPPVPAGSSIWPPAAPGQASAPAAPSSPTAPSLWPPNVGAPAATAKWPTSAQNFEWPS